MGRPSSEPCEKDRESWARPTDLRERGAREEEGGGPADPASAGREPLSGCRIPDSEPLRVEEEWIRSKHPRIASLDQARDRHHAEGQAGHRVEGADVDGAALEGLEGEPLPLEAGLDHLLHLVPAGARGDRAQAAEVGDHLEDGVAIALGTDPLVDDRAQPLDPLRPRGLAGEAVEGPPEQLDHAQERLRVGHVAEATRRGGPRPSPPPRPRAPLRPTRGGRRSTG